MKTAAGNTTNPSTKKCMSTSSGFLMTMSAARDKLEIKPSPCQMAATIKGAASTSTAYASARITTEGPASRKPKTPPMPGMRPSNDSRYAATNTMAKPTPSRMSAAMA